VIYGSFYVSRQVLGKYYPRYDENNPVHKELAELSKAAHEKAGQYVKDNIPQQELSASHLRRLRGAIKKHLSRELGEIDGLVKGIIG